MKKNLPNVFASPINKTISNNKEYYYEMGDRSIEKDQDVLKTINEIFASPSHVYKSRVEITTSEGILNEVIVGKTGNNLLTLDGKRININNILKVKKI